MTHFQAITTGVVDLRNLTFFLSLVLACLFMNAVILDIKKAS